MTQMEFEQHVIDSLARLETNMTSLIGNGKAGRIDKLEAWLMRLAIGMGILAALTLGPSAIALLK